MGPGRLLHNACCPGLSSTKNGLALNVVSAEGTDLDQSPDHEACECRDSVPGACVVPVRLKLEAAGLSQRWGLAQGAGSL